MRRVRILIGEIPQILRAIVENSLIEQPDMELVDTDDGVDLPIAIQRRQADVLIAAEREGDDPGLREQLLVANPHLKVLLVTEDGRQAHLLEFRQVPLAEVSPQGIVEAIRAAMVSGES